MHAILLTGSSPASIWPGLQDEWLPQNFLTGLGFAPTPTAGNRPDRRLGSSAGVRSEAMTVESPTRTCPRCEANVAADARFCANCGLALEAAPTHVEAIQSRLTAAAPEPLIQKMRSAKLSGERKPVTALFVDVVGSTALAEQIDPEDWTAIINEAFDLMSRAVFRYEGTIAQLQGDAMLAFFGAPVAHEDDPERAILAALDMIDAANEYAAELKRREGIDFRIRAGLNTGPVVVGNVGSD